MTVRAGFALLVGALGLVLVARPSTAAPQAVVPEASYAFGAVDRGIPIEHRFAIRNDGTEPLQLEHLKSSCGCTVALASGRDVPPGGTSEVLVRLDTSRITGRTAKTVSVYTNDPATPIIALTLTGQVLADLVAAPTPLYLGRLRRGQSARREITVMPGRPDSSERVTWIENANPAVRATLEALPQGGGQRVVVDVDPAMPLGRFNDRITLHTTSAREPDLVVGVFGSIEGDVLVVPPEVSFGVTDPERTPERDLHVRARGSTALKVVGVTAPEDVVEYDLATVEEGREYRLRIRLRRGLAPGPVAGSIEIRTNLPGEDHLVVPVDALVRREPSAG